MLDLDDQERLRIVTLGVLMIFCRCGKKWAIEKFSQKIDQIQKQQVLTDEGVVIMIVRLQKICLIVKGLPTILETMFVCDGLGQTMKYSPKATVCVAIGFAFVRSLLKLLFQMFYAKPQPDHTDMEVDKADAQKTLTPLIPTSLDKSKEDAPTTFTPDSTNMESDKSKEDAPTTLTPDSTNMESDKSNEDAPTTSPTPDQSTKTDMPAVSVYTDVCGDSYEFFFTLVVQWNLYYYLLEWVFKREKLAYEFGSQEQVFLSRGIMIAVVCRRFSESFHNGEFKPFWEHVWLRAKAGEFRNTPVSVGTYVLFRFVSSWLVNDVLALSTLFLLPVILSQADDEIEFVKDATAVLFIAEMDNMKKHFCTTIRMEIVKNSNKTKDTE